TYDVCAGEIGKGKRQPPSRTASPSMAFRRIECLPSRSPIRPQSKWRTASAPRSARTAPYWLGTFHGLAARQLRASPEVASLRENFDILDADDARRILRRVMKALNLSTDEDESGRRDPVKIVAGLIAKFKDQLMTPKTAAAHVENRIMEANRARAAIDAAGLLSAARAYREYQARLREANAADFGD